MEISFQSGPKVIGLKTVYELLVIDVKSETVL